ncbi:MAG: ABC transporter ATP-binding protein [Acidimicrobiia bacterium]|nr:MAG: ABC transporter ATP-binding protein [Acidimicrobiia bacterium]
MSDAIVCRSVGKAYGGVTALHGFDLTVPAGQILSLVGPSGSGKTTALRVIAGFERPDSGTVVIAGDTVVDDAVFLPPERRRVGMVFQDFALFPHMSVGGNVGYGLGREGRVERVAGVLAMVGLAGMEHRMPHELSGGEQQRVALARALAPSPAVVLLDEPFSNLDAPQREKVRREVRGILTEARATAVFVTHDQEEALAVSDVMAVMRAGSVVQSAAPHDLYRNPRDRWVAEFLGEGEFIEGTVGVGVVETPLGRFPADTGLTGQVEVLIRPEFVRLGAEEGALALVVDREFYGHDQLVTLHLDGGRRLLARAGPDPVYQPGDRIRFAVEEVLVFPSG